MTRTSAAPVAAVAVASVAANRRWLDGDVSVQKNAADDYNKSQKQDGKLLIQVVNRFFGR